MAYLYRAIAPIKDLRQPSNATKYGLSDAILGGFAVFFMQCESFLEHQRQMASRCGQDNAQTLFGLQQVPTVPQIRNILDPRSVKVLRNRLMPDWRKQSMELLCFLQVFC
jgi:hypothetical protein